MRQQTDILEDEAEALEAPAVQLLDRGQKTMRAILHKANTASLDALQTTTNEVGFMMAVARMAIEELGITADVTEKKLHAARLRGLASTVELRKAAEPCLDTGEVCKLMGVSRETVRKKVDRRQLLALPKGGDRVFPSLQFKDGNAVGGLDVVLNALDTDSPFVALSFLLSKHPDFGGKTAIEMLQAGNLEPVILEARGFLKHGG